MINKIHLSSSTWETITGIEVVKPSAWNFNDELSLNWFQTPITLIQFFELCDDSTCFSNSLSRADMIHNAKMNIAREVSLF